MEKILSKLILAIVMLVAAGCAGSAAPPETPPTVDVTGNWVGTWMPSNPSLAGGVIQMTLQQTGSQFTGTLLVSGVGLAGPSGFTQGFVFGDRVRVMQPAYWIGDLVVQGDTMSGMILLKGLPTVGSPMFGGPTFGATAGGLPSSVTLRRR